jgi:MFS family permease
VPIPLWRRPAILRLLVIALLAEIGYAVLNISTMPVYLAAPSGPAGRFIPEGRDLGPSVIGFVLVAFLLSEAVFKSPMGTLADRIGHRKLMLIGPSITACTSVLTLLIPLHSGAFEVAGLILLRIADGVGAAAKFSAPRGIAANAAGTVLPWASFTDAGASTYRGATVGFAN